jgi:LysR family transcriptional regulator, transcription activator of glutamate synthase operon
MRREETRGQHGEAERDHGQRRVEGERGARHRDDQGRDQRGRPSQPGRQPAGGGRGRRAHGVGEEHQGGGGRGEGQGRRGQPEAGGVVERDEGPRGERGHRAGHDHPGTGSRRAGAAREVREEIDPGSGRIVLGFLHLLGRTLVPSLIRTFRERNPGVRFVLAQGSRQDMLRMLREGEIDLVFVAPMPLEDPDLAGRPLAEQELVLSVPPSHRFATRARVRAEELAGEELVTLEHGYGLRQITDDLCAAAGFEPRIAFEGQESETVRGLVAAGLGVAILPREPGLHTPGSAVVEIPLSPPVFRTIGVSWHAGERLTPVVRAFRDHACSVTVDLGPDFRLFPS